MKPYKARSLWSIFALAVVLLSLLLSSFVVAKEAHPALTQAAQAMTLPFTDFRIRVQQGWSEHLSYDRGGIDYILGELDSCGTWQDYDIVSPYTGEACANCGSYIGQAVKIEHQGPDGRTFYTYLGHLSEIWDEIPDHSQGETGYLTVEAGKYLGKSGSVGAPGCEGYGLHHLHFHVLNPATTDPYDLKDDRTSYYPYLPDVTPEELGSAHYWTSDPPTYSTDAQLVLVTPTTQNPANVGSPSNPRELTLEIYAPSRLTSQDFTVRIASAEAAVISANEVSTGEYVLEVQPPTQFTTGLYALTIEASGLSGGLPDSVRYGVTTENNVDVVLVIDRSGSMYGTKMAAAKNAATQFVELMQNGDKSGLVSFAYSAVVDYPLTTIDATVKSELQAEIGSLYASGNTAIGQGLQLAQSELSLRGDPTHPHAIVLLSDGQENVSPYVSAVLPDIVDAGTVVHTIGLGTDVDEALMLDIASQTGGTYHFAPTGDDLVDIYNQISAAVSGQQTVFLRSSSVTQGATDYQQVDIESTVTEATFSISWPGSDLDLVLVAPDGILIDPTVAESDPEIEYSSLATLEFYRLRSAMPGQWQMRVTGVVADPGGEPYTARVAAQTILTLRTDFDRNSYIQGDPVRIVSALTDDQPIMGATVRATVEAPGGITSTITLLDSGGPGDAIAGDGVYSTVYTDTVQLGSYTFLIEADGTSNQGEAFERFERASLVVESNPYPRFDLVIEMHGPSNAGLGDVITFDVTYYNNGPYYAYDTIVALDLPDAFVYDPYLSDGAILTDGLLLWNTGDLSPGVAHSMTISATVQRLSLEPQETTVGIGSEVTSGDTPPPYDPIHENNFVTITTLVQERLFMPIIER